MGLTSPTRQPGSSLSDLDKLDNCQQGTTLVFDFPELFFPYFTALSIIGQNLCNFFKNFCAGFWQIFWRPFSFPISFLYTPIFIDFLRCQENLRINVKFGSVFQPRSYCCRVLLKKRLLKVSF